VVERAEVERAVESARSKAERIQFLGALLSKATGQETIIVGGSAIEVYTSGQTSSLDIDIVTSRKEAAEVIESWGFVANGRIWRRRDWGVDIDLLGSRYSGSKLRIRKMQTPFGPVLLSGIEDLLVKRLAELKHWPTTRDWRADLIKQASILIAEYSDQLDEEYLKFIARRDDVVDILGDFRARRGLATPSSR